MSRQQRLEISFWTKKKENNKPHENTGMQQSTTAKGIASRGMQAQLHSPIMHQAVVYFQMRDFHDSITIFFGQKQY